MQDFGKFHFISQRADEKIVSVSHRHWINILQQFILVLGMLFLLIFVRSVFMDLFPSLFRDPVLSSLFLFFEIVFAMLIWIVFFVIWIDYYFDIWIVTNQRIIAIYQNGLFGREVSELKFERIQDVSIDVSGIIPTFFNYGDVLVQTAGEVEKFIFVKVPDPYAVKNVIMNMQRMRRKQDTNELGEMIEKKIVEGL